MLLVLCACGPIVPAETPAQLNQTPGPPVIVTTDVYIATTFAARYPDGWQVITSPAFSETWVVFTSETAVIGLALDTDDIAGIEPPVTDTDLQREQQTISLDSRVGGQTITALLVAPAVDWDTYQAVFQQVVRSIAHPSAYVRPRAGA